MRYSEILNELRATKTAFGQILTNASINFGFECEVILDAEAVPRSMDTPNNMDWETLELYFDGDSDGMQEFRADSRASEYDTDDDFVKHEYGSNQKALVHYNIPSLYGWIEDHGASNHKYFWTEAEDDTDAFRAYEDAADDLKDILGVDIEIFGSYHGLEKNPNRWYIEPDSSIKAGKKGVGAEFVSQVYSLKDGLAHLDAFLAWVREKGHYTNASTGLHINLSIDGKEGDDYDFLKMVVLFDEKHSLSAFNRLKNTFAQPLKDKLSAYLQGYGYDLTDKHGPQGKERSVLGSKTKDGIARILKDIGRNARFELTSDEKYFTINNRENGIFEFRSMGGAGYEKKYDSIRSHVVNMAMAMIVGGTPSLMLKEYLTKIVLALGGKFDAEKAEAPMWLSSFANYFSDDPAKFSAIQGKASPKRNEQMVNLVARIFSDHAFEGNGEWWTDLSDQQKRQLKYLIKKEGLMNFKNQIGDMFDPIASARLSPQDYDDGFEMLWKEITSKY